jgi:hypothetical protein
MNSLTINRDILKIKRLSMDKSFSLSKRKEFIQQLSRIPHKDKNKHIIDCLLALISDDTYSIDDRYSLFSNSRLFDNDVLSSSHQFYFHNFHPPIYPMRYKILSAQYLINNVNKEIFDLRDVNSFLRRLYNDPSQEYNIRAECLDILRRNGDIGAINEIEDDFDFLINTNHIPLANNNNNNPVITNNTTRRIIVSRRTVYEDGQNVHSGSINESVKNTIRELYKEYGSVLDSKYRLTQLNEVSKRIVFLSDRKKLGDVTRKKINGSFDRIMIDTSRFENQLGLIDVLILVWNKIKSSKDKDELENRLIEELDDMNGLCATGHLSRIVNILSGFYDGIIKISFKEQIKNYVFSHYNKVLKTHPNCDIILEEMIQDEKHNILKMVKDNNNKKELYQEFVVSYLVTDSEFDIHYQSAVSNYCGILS